MSIKYIIFYLIKKSEIPFFPKFYYNFMFENQFYLPKGTKKNTFIDKNTATTPLFTFHSIMSTHVTKPITPS